MNPANGELRIDFHVHSSRSVDAFNPVWLWERFARWRQLDGLAITDHNQFDPERLRDLRDRTDLLLVPGQEISTRIGHLLAYFIDSPIQADRDVETAIDRIHEQGGLAVLAHPYRSRMSYREEILSRLDAVEFHNARSGSPGEEDSPNARTRRTFRELDLPRLGGSDAHFPWEVGRAFTRVSSDSNLTALREALAKGNVRPGGGISSGWNRWWSRRIHRLRS